MPLAVKSRVRFYPRQPMVATQRFRGLSAGDRVPRASHKNLRRWLRLGWIDYKNDLRSIEKEAQKASKAKAAQAAKVAAENAEPSEPETAPEPTPEPEVPAVTAVSAKEGKQGWYVVTFSDGSEEKMRRAAMEEAGIFDQLEAHAEG